VTKIRILHLLHSSKVGGTENAVLKNISNSSSEFKNYVAIYEESGDLNEAFQLNTENYLNLTDTNNIFKKVYKLIRFARENEINILYGYGTRMSIMLRVLNYKKEFKVIYGVRNMFQNHTKLVSAIDKLTINKNSLVISNSVSAKNYMRKVYNPRIPMVSIPNGIERHENFKESYNIQQGLLRIICVANLKKVKGHIYLIEAMKTVIKENDNVMLYLAGEGIEDTNLKKKIQELNLTNHIQMLGKVSDIGNTLAEYDIFVLPSLSEGFPNSLMEAMLAGLPTISTNVGGIPELIKNEENGLLINKESSHEIAQSINSLMFNEELRIQLGNKARDTILNKYLLDKIIIKTEDEYRKLLL